MYCGMIVEGGACVLNEASIDKQPLLFFLFDRPRRATNTHVAYLMGYAWIRYHYSVTVWMEPIYGVMGFGVGPLALQLMRLVRICV